MSSENSAPVTVLVIDDSNTIRRSAEIFLGQGGYKVVLAEDGFDALAKINDHEPTLIFCDILMPRLDGYQTCAIIKRNARFAQTPVIMLSSKDGLFDKARGRMVGAQDYLTKPFTKDQLLQAVRHFSAGKPGTYCGDILCTGIVAPERVRNNQEQTGTTFVGAFVNDSTIFFTRLASAPAVLVTVTRVEGSAVFASNDGLVSVFGGQPSLKESQALFRRRDWRAKYGNARLNLRMAHHDGYLLGLVDPSYPIARTEEPFLLKLDEAAGSYCRLDAGQALYGAAVSGTTDQLFVTTATGFAEFATGDDLTYVWQSGDRLFPLPTNFAAGVVDAVGAASLQVFADGALRATVAISGRTSFRLPSGNPAYRWSVKLTGTATVREISLAGSFAELKGA